MLMCIGGAEKFNVSWLNKFIFLRITKNWLQYSVSHVATMALSQNASEAISQHLISKNFLGEHAPRPPSLVCFNMHVYIHIRHPCNPPCGGPLQHVGVPKRKDS